MIFFGLPISPLAGFYFPKIVFDFLLEMSPPARANRANSYLKNLQSLEGQRRQISSLE
jgi:hypothetical protein